VNSSSKSKVNGVGSTIETSFGDATSTSYSDTTLTLGDVVSYRIAAINAEGQGPFSNIPTPVTTTEIDVIEQILNSIAQLIADLAQEVADRIAGDIDLQSQIDAIPADSAPQAFHLKGTQTSTTGSNIQINGLSKTFTLSEATVVFVSSDVEIEYSIPSGQFTRAMIVIDNVIVSTGPFLDDDGTVLMVYPNHVSWTGQLSAGTHTISTSVFDTGGGTACSRADVGCNMNILVLGQ